MSVDIEITGNADFNHKINKLTVKLSTLQQITITSTESIDELEVSYPHTLIMIKTNVTSFKKIRISPGQRLTFYDMDEKPLHLPFLEICEYGEICHCVLYNPTFINLAYASTFNMNKKGDFIGCIDCQGVVMANIVNIINVNVPTQPLDLVIRCDE